MPYGTHSVTCYLAAVPRYFVIDGILSGYRASLPGTQFVFVRLERPSAHTPASAAEVTCRTMPLPWRRDDADDNHLYVRADAALVSHGVGTGETHSGCVVK